MPRLTRTLGALGALVVATLGACSEATSSTAPPGAGKWTREGDTPEARLEGFAIADGKRILYLGGIYAKDNQPGLEPAEPSDRVDVYDTSSKTWSPGPPLPADAAKHHLTVEGWGGRIYLLGGFDGIIGRAPGEEFHPVASAFVLEGGGWRRLADAPLARGGATAKAIGGKIYVAGGAPREGAPPYADLQAYDPTRDAWEVLAPMPTAREHVASCALSEKLIVVGGWVGAAQTVVAAAEVFDPATGRWERLPDLPTARGGLAAIALGGRCHVIGGERWDIPFPGTFSEHEVLDLEARSWSTRAAMPTARHGFGLALVDGMLFAMGGGIGQGNTYTTAIERYAP
jgi:Kelch motif/Galactose oxidase, central domain